LQIKLILECEHQSLTWNKPIYLLVELKDSG
jgi:hypothetical protein